MELQLNPVKVSIIATRLGRGFEPTDAGNFRGLIGELGRGNLFLFV
jgi:hypothetical protein